MERGRRGRRRGGEEVEEGKGGGLERGTMDSYLATLASSLIMFFENIILSL